MTPASASGPPKVESTSPPDSTAAFSPSNSTKKRKASSTTSRGVACLTADQLAKKRANDRDAQRAIRERTRTQIVTLEKRVQELTSQQPYQELQNIIRQKEAIQAENEEIRRRLESVLAVIQSIVTAHGLTGICRSWVYFLSLGHVLTDDVVVLQILLLRRTSTLGLFRVLRPSIFLLLPP